MAANEPDFTVSSNMHWIGPPFMSYAGGISASLSLARPEGRGHSPTHPKHLPRDAPVPPSLAAKKRQSTGKSISSKLLRKRSRSASAAPVVLAPEDTPEMSSGSSIIPGRSRTGRGRRSFSGDDEVVDLEEELGRKWSVNAFEMAQSPDQTPEDVPASTEILAHTAVSNQREDGAFSAHDSDDPPIRFSEYDVPHG